MSCGDKGHYIFRASRSKLPNHHKEAMMQTTDSFFFPTSKGKIQILIGQCFRPGSNSTIKKINHFQSTNGYSRWIVAVAKDVKLSYAEVEDITKRAMALVVNGVSSSVCVQEVA